MCTIKMCYCIKIRIKATLKCPRRASIIYMSHLKGSLHLTSELACYFNLVLLVLAQKGNSSFPIGFSIFQLSGTDLIKCLLFV